MALQIWLPLNGDLHNQGLSNLTITNNGATIDNNGKIGKCYSFNGTDNYLVFNNLTCSNWATFSLTCWCYPSSDFNYLFLIRGGGAHRVRISGDGFMFRDSNNSTQRIVGFGTTIPLNTWSHITCVYNRGEIFMYVNGVLTNHSTTYYHNNSTFLSDHNEVRLARQQSSSGSSYYNGKINDFRIYDHCLSDKEVEEISKGLVLHYQLNNGNPNLLSEYVTPGQGAPGVTSTGGRTNYYGKYGIIIPATENADTYFRLFLKQQLVQGNTYTISCYVSGLLPGSSYNFPLFAQGNTSMGILQLNHNGLCSLTFTMNSSSQKSVTTPEGDTVYICFMDDSSRTLASGQGAIIINGFKLEQGNNVTNFLSIDNDIIYDSSGYNNNGEIINTLSTEIPSPKNNISLHFSATNQKIKISGLSTTGFSNSYSFAWWEKINSVAPMHWGFSDGVRLNGMYTGRLWNTGDGSNNPLYNPGTTTQVAAPSVNIWHHWVMTGDGTKCRVYQDGILWAEAKTYKTITGTTIYINGWDTNTNYSSDNASISDFRIYATALTAGQIKELYKTSKIIDGTTVKARDLEAST